MRQVDIEHVRVDRFEAGVNCLLEDVPAGWSSSARLFVASVYGRHIDDDRRFSAAAKFQAQWDLSEDDPRSDAYPEDHAVEIEAIYEVRYRLSGDEVVSEEDLEHFCAFNATFNAWPYWREFAQSASLRLGLPPLVVDVLKVPGLSTGSKDSPREVSDVGFG